MNPSLAILQKIKTQFLHSAADRAAFQVAFAPFAFTLSTQDFAFLKGVPADGPAALQALQDQSEFACMVNSMLRHPVLWRIDGEHQLDRAWRSLLAEARLVDPDVFTPAETTRLAKARAVLFKADGNDTARYKAYKACAAQMLECERALIEHQGLRAALAPGDSQALSRWSLDLQALSDRKRDLAIAWQAKGYKSQVESAKATFEQIVGARQQFIARWAESRSLRTAPPNLLTDALGQEFLATSALPNAIAEAGAPVWRTLSLDKAEIARLASAFAAEVSPAVLAEFGDVAPELERIRFDWCLLDIQRPWFDDSLLTSRCWALPEGAPPASAGPESLDGLLSAYPVKLILARNIELAFAPGSAVNDDIRNRLKAGQRLLSGSLLLKTMPANLPEAQAQTLRVQALTPLELHALAAVAAPAPAPAPEPPPGPGPAPKPLAGRLQSLQALQLHALPVLKRIQAPPVLRDAPALPVLHDAPATPVPRDAPAMPAVAAAPQAPLQAKATLAAIGPAMALRAAPAAMAMASVGVATPVLAKPLAARPLAKPLAAQPLVKPVLAQPIWTTPPLVLQPVPKGNNPVADPPAAPPPPPAPPPAPAAAVVAGRVIDNANQPQRAAEVQLLRLADATSQSVLTDDDGHYQMPPQPPGAYQLRVRKTGFELVERPLQLAGDTTQDVLLAVQAVPVESFQVIGVVCRRLPRLPDPLPGLQFS